LIRPRIERAAELVAWFGAVQAQEYGQAKWGLGLRLPADVTDAHVERAIDAGSILRTHVLRPTWHFVARSDIHWLLELTAPRVHQKMAFAYRHYELDPAMRVRAASAMERAVGDGRHLTRAELAAHLAECGIAVKGVRLALLTICAELERVVCSGRRRGSQFTYALLASRAARRHQMSRDEALAELTTRYFQSHGPATTRDFAWWSGLTVADAKRGLAIVRARSEAIEGRTYWSVRSSRSGAATTPRCRVHLLPIYDEYLVAYRDRDLVVASAPGRNTLGPSVLAGGRVAGAWKASVDDGLASIDVTPLRRWSAVETRALGIEAARYGRFVGKRVGRTRVIG
jgi:winged helix DNA-binding protein